MYFLVRTNFEEFITDAPTADLFRARESYVERQRANGHSDEWIVFEWAMVKYKSASDVLESVKQPGQPRLRITQE